MYMNLENMYKEKKTKTQHIYYERVLAPPVGFLLEISALATYNVRNFPQYR